MSFFEVKIAERKHPFTGLRLDFELYPPESFEISIPSLENINIGDQVEVYRNGLKIFTGLVEKKTLKLTGQGIGRETAEESLELS